MLEAKAWFVHVLFQLALGGGYAPAL